MTLIDPMRGAGPRSHSLNPGILLLWHAPHHFPRPDSSSGTDLGTEEGKGAHIYWGPSQCQSLSLHRCTPFHSHKLKPGHQPHFTDEKAGSRKWGDLLQVTQPWTDRADPQSGPGRCRKAFCSSSLPHTAPALPHTCLLTTKYTCSPDTDPGSVSHTRVPDKGQHKIGVSLG